MKYIDYLNEAEHSIINIPCSTVDYLLKIPDLKILRIYGQEIERKEFPVPDQITEIRSLFPSKRAPVQLKADEDLKDVSLHHVIRSADCPFAKALEEYDKEFKRCVKDKCNAPRELIDAFNKVTSSSLRICLGARLFKRYFFLREVIIEYFKIRWANVKG